MFGPVVLRPKLIWHSQVPDSTPTTPLWLRPTPLLGTMARLPVMRVLVFFNDSKHAAGVCLGTTLTRTHVQLGLSCQRLLLKVQHKLRFTLQHVYSHAENLGNECADHAAALGAFCLVSNQNLSTGWARHSFDSALYFATCNNLGDVLESACYSERSMFLPLGNRPGVGALFHTVPQGGLSCLYHRPLACFSFTHLTQSFTVCMIEEWVVH